MITRPDQITPQWLTAVLRENGYLQRGNVASLTAQPLDSHAQVALALTLAYSHNASASAPRQLVCKMDSSPAAYSIYGEILFYTEIAVDMARRGMAVAAPIFYGGAFDHEKREGYLLLEDVSRSHAPRPEGSLTQTECALIVDGLSQLHIAWWEHPRIIQPDFMRPQGGPLRMAQALDEAGNERHYAMLTSLFAERLTQIGGQLSPEQQNFCQRVVENWPHLWRERTQNGRQLTLIHGDAHYDGNIWIPKGENGRIKILDWETFKRSIGVYDLAYMFAYNAATRRQHELFILQRYQANIQAAGIDYDKEQCLADYRLALMMCLFPPLLWPHETALHTALQACADWNCADLLAN